jgi:putative ABC transport system permease protein
VITRCLRDRLFPGDAGVLGRVVRAVDAPPARVVAVIEDVMLRDPWNAHGSCVSIRFGWPPDERESRFLARARPGQRDQLVAGLRAVLGPSTPERLVEILPFDPRDTQPARMARGLVVNLGVFAAIVIVTALLGTLTVSSFLVHERTRSIGIRRALGAAPPDIVRYFLVETAILTAFGVALGLVFTAAVFWLMQGLYPGVQLSVRALVLTAVLLWAGATLGALHPARQAARIPPWTAARSG